MRSIFKVFLPTLFSYLTFMMVNIIDGIFVGNLYGIQGQSAMGLVTPIVLLSNFLIFSIIIGGNTYLGHALGENDDQEVNKIFNHVVGYGTAIVFSVLIIMTFLSIFVVSNFIHDPIVLEYFKSYIVYMLPSITVVYVCIFLNFTQRVLGNVSISVKTSILSLVINIIFNYLLTIVFGLGIQGIAIASLISFIVQLIYLVLVFRKSDVEKFKLKVYKFDYKLFFKMVYNGLSDAIFDLSNALVQILNISILFYFVQDLGSSYVYVLNSILLVQIMVFFSLGDSINPLIAVEYGKKNNEKIIYYKNIALKIAFFAGIMGYLLLTLIKGPLLSVFGITQGSAREYLMYYSKYYFLVVTVFGMNQVLIAYLTAIGQSKLSLIIGVFRNLIIIILVTLCMSFLFNEIGLWLSYFISEVIAFIFTIIILSKKKLLKNAIIK